MKNITRRGFLQLTAATALVCAAAPLTGCGKKNKKELIIGTWYRQGSDDLAFTIYDDGTCMIDNDYGKGTWSIANEDQFTLTGFYGNSEIFTIIAIDKKSVTLARRMRIRIPTRQSYSGIRLRMQKRMLGK